MNNNLLLSKADADFSTICVTGATAYVTFLQNSSPTQNSNNSNKYYLLLNLFPIMATIPGTSSSSSLFSTRSRLLFCSRRKMARQEIRYRSRSNRTWLNLQIPNLLSHGSPPRTSKSPHQGRTVERRSGHVEIEFEEWTFVYVDGECGAGIQGPRKEDCVLGGHDCC